MILLRTRDCYCNACILVEVDLNAIDVCYLVNTHFAYVRSMFVIFHAFVKVKTKVI